MNRASSPRVNKSASTGVQHEASVADRGVLLLNLGSPDAPTPEAVRVYLREFLVDPAVIQLPRFMRWFNVPLGRMIALFRCKASAHMYQTIWSEKGSPLLSITDEQVSELQQIMPHGWRVYSAMRYGNPSIPATLKQIQDDGIQDLVVIPMYPQYSGPTTGTAMKVVYDYLSNDPHPLQVTTRLNWFNDHSYITAQSQLLKTYASQHGLTPENSYLLFSAHGLPESYVRKGDPYPEHIAQTVSLVTDRAGWTTDRSSLAFQSRFGPAKWLQPYTDEVLKELAEAGEKRIVVCPVSFTVDCLETLEEIDVRYRALVEESGSELFVTPSLNTFKPFIAGLKHLALQGCSPINGNHVPKRRFDRERAQTDQELDTRTLVMVGASIPGRMPSTHEPVLHHTNGETLRALKRQACAVPDLLRDVVEAAGLEEAFLWNTCHRFELYGWLPSGSATGAAEHSAAVVREHILDNRPVDADELNVLTGTKALRHMLRTAAGLNSTLPGERDVLGQLQAALRLAERAGTVGPRARGLLHRVESAEREVRQNTPWKSYSPDYAQVALQHVADQVKFDWLNCRVVVLGGSTTSAAVLKALTNHFGVPSKQLTIVYRGHKKGNHLNVLRKAIGSGKRVRVGKYDEAVVDRAIAQADILVLGVDHKEPLFDADRLRRACGEDHPLTVVDFNSFPSTKDLDSQVNVNLFEIQDIDAAVRQSAAAMCADDSFQEAFRVCDEWLHANAESENAETSNSNGKGHRDQGPVRTALTAIERNHHDCPQK